MSGPQYFLSLRVAIGALIQGQLVLPEFANGENGPVNRKRWSDHIDARAVGKTRVADWRSVVDPAPHLTDNTLANVHQLRIVAKANVGQLDLAADLDEGAGGTVHHDIGNVVATKKWFEGPIAENIVADIVDQIFLFAARHGDVLDRDDFVDDVADFLARVFRVEARQLRQIDRLDKRAADHAFRCVIVVGTLRLRGRLRRRRGALNSRDADRLCSHGKSCRDCEAFVTGFGN